MPAVAVTAHPRQEYCRHPKYEPKPLHPPPARLGRKGDLWTESADAAQGSTFYLVLLLSSPQY